jgi:hypothetical protein
MRALLMIGNNNLSLRELYTIVLDNHAAGWTTAYMSGMPQEPEAIVSGYDAVVYELGAPDSESRVDAVTSLRRAGVPVITHVEGRQEMTLRDRLLATGVVVVRNPLAGETISEALDRVSLGGTASRRRVGLRERFRRLLGG